MVGAIQAFGLTLFKLGVLWASEFARMVSSILSFRGLGSLVGAISIAPLVVSLGAHFEVVVCAVASSIDCTFLADFLQPEGTMLQIDSQKLYLPGTVFFEFQVWEFDAPFFLLCVLPLEDHFLLRSLLL